MKELNLATLGKQQEILASIKDNFVNRLYGSNNIHSDMVMLDDAETSNSWVTAVEVHGNGSLISVGIDGFYRSSPGTANIGIRVTIDEGEPQEVELSNIGRYVENSGGILYGPLNGLVYSPLNGILISSFSGQAFNCASKQVMGSVLVNKLLPISFNHLKIEYKKSRLTTSKLGYMYNLEV